MEQITTNVIRGGDASCWRSVIDTQSQWVVDLQQDGCGFYLSETVCNYRPILYTAHLSSPSGVKIDHPTAPKC